MNSEERIVKKFLVEQGFKSIDFEPNGEKTAPDFSVDGNVAIEVRRLNKQVTNINQAKPIENFEYKLVPKFKNLLNDLNNPELEYSIGVILTYKRPLTVTKKLIAELKKSIIEHSNDEVFKEDIHFNEKITYSLWKANGRTEKTYELVGQHDLDKGGVVQDDRYVSLKIAIAEKSEKLSSLQNSYAELWLILVDDIFSRVDKSSVALSRYPKIDSIFDKIILISKRDPRNWVYIHPWSD